MPRIIITARVKDAAKWEEGFRTHGALLRSMTTTVTYYTMTEGNEVALYAEAADLDKYLEVLESQDTAEAMAFDGVIRESVKIFVLEKEFRY